MTFTSIPLPAFPRTTTTSEYQRCIHRMCEWGNFRTALDYLEILLLRMDFVTRPLAEQQHELRRCIWDIEGCIERNLREIVTRSIHEAEDAYSHPEYDTLQYYETLKEIEDFRREDEDLWKVLQPAVEEMKRKVDAMCGPWHRPFNHADFAELWAPITWGNIWTLVYES